MNVNDLKIVIYEDMSRLTKNLMFYVEKNGKRYYAEPVNLVFKEDLQGSICEPTISIRSEYFDLEIENRCKPSSGDVLLKQKELDKNYHIKNLDEIIKKLIEVKI